ncbi:cyclic lactone autoinducer peptide [Ruminococcus flavefaciens]|uniref:cyclic lactone autoinducer peptide n=1 Tax=Ruminococcus flavefaciens TaxID=1265 RepID=UPI0026ED9786|nr:cyclic lactone autoinducer peptide [Ruminococcus flavefaciens]
MKKEVLKEKAVLIVGKLLKKEVDRKISDEWPPGCAALFYQPKRPKKKVMLMPYSLLYN